MWGVGVELGCWATHTMLMRQSLSFGVTSLPPNQRTRVSPLVEML